MKLSRSVLSVLLAVVMLLTPLAIVPEAANVNDTNGAMELQYRYGTNNLIQMNTNLPSDTPLANFLASDNGCNIDQSGNAVQWVGWIQMLEDNGTIVLTFHFNQAFEAGQSYVLPAGAIFGFTDGKTYMLDKNYTFTFDGSGWSMTAENPALSLQTRWGTANLLQLNTNLPADTVCANFTYSDNGSSVDETANRYQQAGWVGMDKAGSTIVLSVHFNREFLPGQTYFLPAGAVLGFQNGIKYTLDRDYTFYYDGNGWSEEPVLTLECRWGAANVLQLNTNLELDTPCVDFLVSDNGCQIDQSINKYQQVGYISMTNVVEEGKIILTFNFGSNFSAGQTYILPEGAIFGFTNGVKYKLLKEYTFLYDGSSWKECLHTEYTPDVKAPTCTEGGYTTYTCVCGKSYTDNATEATGHHYESVVTPPTAIKQGFTTHTCTGCGDSYVDSYTEPVGIGQLAFSGATLTLEQKLSVNFRANSDLFIEDAYSAPYAVFTFGHETVTVTDYEIVDGKYQFTCHDITPSQINDTIHATLYATLNGEKVSAEMTYSVSQYCLAMLEKNISSELNTLIVDLMYYGAAAQVYSGYVSGVLVTDLLSEEQKSLHTTAAPAMNSVLNTSYATVDSPKATWKAAALVLNDNVALRYRFAADSVEGLSVKVQAAGETWVIDTFEAVPGKDGQYYVYFDELAAHMMRETVLITVYEGDTAVSNTLSYSIESYAAQVAETAREYALMVEMLRYGDSAIAYAS